MIKVSFSHFPYSVTKVIWFHLDMEHEEERGRSGEEKAEDQRRADPGTKRCASWPQLVLTSLNVHTRSDRT